MDRISVPSVGVTLSGPLSVIALVGHYPTPTEIGVRQRSDQLADTPQAVPLAPEGFTLARLSDISPGFPELFLTMGYVPTCYYLVCH